MAAKLKESANEKYKSQNIFPTLSETFEKIQELCVKLDFSFMNLSKSTIGENQNNSKTKKTKVQILKTTKIETAKVSVSVAKWTDPEITVLTKEEIIKMEDDEEKQDCVISNAPKQLAKCILVPLSQISKNLNEKNASNSLTRSEETSNLTNSQKTIATSNFEESAPSSMVKSPAFDLLTTSKATEIRSSVKSLHDAHSKIAENKLDNSDESKNEPVENASDSKNIEKYILENKSRLTELDVCILHSMVRCYSKVERDRSRYEFASRQPTQRMILERYASLNNLISSFFKDESDLLRCDESRRSVSETNKYFKLFNQSYTFERFD